jgi:hypothetical protein
LGFVKKSRKNELMPFYFTFITGKKRRFCDKDFSFWTYSRTGTPRNNLQKCDLLPEIFNWFLVILKEKKDRSKATSQDQ